VYGGQRKIQHVKPVVSPVGKKCTVNPGGKSAQKENLMHLLRRVPSSLSYWMTVFPALKLKSERGKKV